MKKKRTARQKKAWSAPPRQRRALITKKRLFAAANSEFSAKGFHGARVDRIAARAGVNKQRLYALFGNKAGLFKEVLCAAFDEIETAERLLAELTEADAPRLAETLLKHYIEFHGRHPHFWRLLAWENLAGGRHSAELAGTRRATFRHLKKLYGIAQQRGIHSPKTSFSFFLFTLTALSYFAHSNQATIKRTLGLDALSSAGRKALIRNISALISFRPE